ncbi:DUF6114 domain-containing protein [Streptomyces sp. NPDC014006]|uniref:DUF6114 domain-containing protein n=1 Tax=Streptomyces sp. NPDC014006 TaxID=3364870 RepID=UPI0036F88770
MFLSRRAWRTWRRSRPFWGGLATVVAGSEICILPLAPLEVMLKQGVAGLPSVLLGLVMIVLGLSAWVAPHHRGLAGVLTVLLAVAALVMSNLGGFLFGTVLGIVGGSMIFAWQPVPAADAPAEPTAEAPADTDAAEPAATPATTESAEPTTTTPTESAEPRLGTRGSPPPTGATVHRIAPTVAVPPAAPHGKGSTP